MRKRSARPSSIPVLLLLMLATGALPRLATAQAATLTAADYERAERALPWNTTSLVHRAEVDPEFLDDGRFWYGVSVPGGTEYVLVDPEEGTRGAAFDHERMAAAVSVVSGTDVAAGTLSLREVEPTEEGLRLTLGIEERRFRCDTEGYTCESVTPVDERSAEHARSVSPDGAKAVFIRGHDLWLHDLETGEETRLTHDGVEDFGYATNNAGWIRSDRPVVRWSPDSRRIATFRHDARGVGMMYLVNTEVGHPELDAWRYPLPEDTVIFRITRMVIDTEAAEGERIVRLRMPPDLHRSTVCDHVYCGGTFADNHFSEDGASLAFVSTSRDHKRSVLRIADTSTGEVRDVLEEVEETFYESGGNWRYLSGSDEIVWYSQRDDWGHLYLHDARTGELKNRITEGAWNVLEIVRVDPGTRTLYFMGNEREPGDPYFEYLYRIGLDGSGLELLTPDSAHHDVTFTPDGRHFVDTYSTPVDPPVSVLRTLDGDIVTVLEEADVSELVAAGWEPPIPFTVKARDGVTDLHGLMFRPRDFDPDRSYPVVNYVYPGPQTGSVGSRSFSPGRRDHDAMAELGFVVVALDAMGTPKRSKSFHDAYYGNMGDNGLPDQIAAIRQLAERHEWIDLDRVGIWGHSGGGFAAAQAIFRYPDFYKVAVSQAGNHDNRNYEDDWGEKWQGLLVEHEDGTTNYDNQANHLLAGNLEGKLLLAHGTLDDNVPPSNTMLVVNALIEANEDFDLILFPNRRHGFAYEPYMLRKRWDYLVEHLMGAEPPEAYDFGELEPR